MIKQSIAVYNPQDILERAIQNAYHKFTNEYLGMDICKLCTDAIVNLKRFSISWLENESLLSTRIEYFFHPAFSKNRDEMVFLTFPIFLREIIETEKINNHVYSPITLVSLPIAHFLFPEYPIQLFVNVDKLKKDNPDSNFIEVGSLLTVCDDLRLTVNSIVKIAVVKQCRQAVEQIVNNCPLNKTAVIQVSRGIFKIDNHTRAIRPNTGVVRKKDKQKGRVISVEPGEAGNIIIEMGNQDQIQISKTRFDQDFYVPKVATAKRKRSIENLIKEKLKSNKVVQKLAKEYGISLDRIDKLKIVITKLKKKYAETDANVMKLNTSLFENGIEHFFENKFFILIHEIVHWFTRIKEQDAYFNDPEEVLGFVAAIAHEITRTDNIKEIWDRIYPEMAWHFNNKKNAEIFFKRCVLKARQLLK